MPENVAPLDGFLRYPSHRICFGQGLAGPVRENRSHTTKSTIYKKKEKSVYAAGCTGISGPVTSDWE